VNKCDEYEKKSKNRLQKNCQEITTVYTKPQVCLLRHTLDLSSLPNFSAEHCQVCEEMMCKVCQRFLFDVAGKEIVG